MKIKIKSKIEKTLSLLFVNLISSLKVLGYLVKKRKSGDSIKHCMVLSKLAYLGSKL